MKSILLFFILSVPVMSQTQVSLRQKYGTPLTETFVIKPGITLTATYSPAGEVREMIIAPERPPTVVKSTITTLDYKLLHQMIDELVPPKDRGDFIMGSLLNIACLPKNDCAGGLEDYKKLMIYYNAGEKGANYVVIQWKGR